MLNKCHIYLACTDTPSWNDGFGDTCEDYRLRSYCQDNSAGLLAGFAYNFPERNCCGCGKGKEAIGSLFKLQKNFIDAHIYVFNNYLCLTSNCGYIILRL